MRRGAGVALLLLVALSSLAGAPAGAGEAPTVAVTLANRVPHVEWTTPAGFHPTDVEIAVQGTGVAGGTPDPAATSWTGVAPLVPRRTP